MNTTAPTECKAWADLTHHAESWRGVQLRDLFKTDVAREIQFVAEAPGLKLDYSRQRLGAMTLRLLARLADERGFAQWRDALLSGKKVNSTEDRPAWHTALRAGGSLPPEVHQTLARMKSLSEKIRSEGRIRRIVNLGTGGSDLGPRLLADALSDGQLDVRFAANVDPLDLKRALEGAEPASTLFVVASKTFTTQETMANVAQARGWGARHLYAVTANLEAAKAFGAAEVLPMWDWVGGPLLGMVGGRLFRRLRHGLPRLRGIPRRRPRDRQALRRRAAREERAGAAGAVRRLEHELPGRDDARGAALLERAAPAARVPAAARDGVERQARRPRRPRARLRDRAGALGRRRAR
jgi:hypothetical protein